MGMSMFASGWTDEAYQGMVDRIGKGRVEVLDAEGRVLVTVPAELSRVSGGKANLKGEATVARSGIAKSYVLRAEDGRKMRTGPVGEGGMALDKSKLVEDGDFALEFEVRFK